MQKTHKFCLNVKYVHFRDKWGFSVDEWKNRKVGRSRDNNKDLKGVYKENCVNFVSILVHNIQ